MVKIKEPWWGAWKNFGWKKGTWGIGISKTIVDVAAAQSLDLKIEVWKFKSIYVIPAQDIVDYVTANNTAHIAKGTVLYVIPSTMLQPLVNTSDQA